MTVEVTKNGVQVLDVLLVILACDQDAVFNGCNLYGRVQFVLMSCGRPGFEMRI